MNTEPDSVRCRLEERVTYCEGLVDSLNGVVTDLQKRMLALEHRYQLLLEIHRQQEEASGEVGSADEKPPHY